MKNKNWLIASGVVSVLIILIIIFKPLNYLSNEAVSQAGTDEAGSSKEQQTEPAAEQQEETQQQPEDREKESDSEDAAEPFTIAFTGDIMFDWDLRPVLEEKGYDYPFKHVTKDLRSADYTVANLETSITERTQKTDGQLYWIKSEPESLQALKNTGTDMVNIGNNHVLDYGEEGLLDTIKAVEDHGFAYMGAGRNAGHAYEPKIVEINNQTVAFLSFTRFFPATTWAATADKPGVTNGYHLDFVIETIKEKQALADADYFIVNFHWGVEKTNIPAAYQREYVKRIVEETETDAIVGSHPHWLQGFEFYQDVPVAYSLGNFLFPDYVTGHTAETGVYNLTFNDGEVTADFIPYVIEDNQIQPLFGTEKQAMYDYLDKISINAALDEEGNITKEE